MPISVARAGKNKRLLLSFISALVLFCSETTLARPTLPAGMTPADIDTVVSRARSAFHVPGVAVAVVHDGQIVFAKGYGQRSENPKSASVDTRTLFSIASNSKQFTASALAILVQEGKLKWDDRVIDHMPEFRVSDPWITREFRVSDLLTHHSGMGQGAGDMMLFSHSIDSRADVLAALPYMPFTNPFRSDYAYNNLLYVVAGHLVEKISGQSWEDFVQKRLLDAAGLQACQTRPPTRSDTDVATGEGGSETLPNHEPQPLPAMAPAGGIWCSVDGMARWAQTLLNGGTTIEGRQILDTKQRDILWSPHALLPLPDSATLTDTHFRAYGYGWFMEDFHGLKRVWHTGNVNGMTSYFSFIPEKNTAFVVLTNHDDWHAPYAIMNTLSTTAVGAPAVDWVAHWKAESDHQAAANRKEAETNGPGSPAHPFITLTDAELDDYAGTYHDSWRGDIRVERQGHHLVMTFVKTDGLAGTLTPLPHDLFVVKWNDRATDAGDDCYVQFHRDVTGKVIDMRLRVIGSDFSFDAQDLHPQKVFPAIAATRH